MIKDYRFDTASAHDSKHIDEFIEQERDAPKGTLHLRNCLQKNHL